VAGFLRGGEYVFNEKYRSDSQFPIVWIRPNNGAQRIDQISFRNSSTGELASFLKLLSFSFV
jgi:hypothetical protein